MAIQELPDDIMVQIRLRLPAKSLMRFKCVSKPWRSLITHPNFVSNHLNHHVATKAVDNEEFYRSYIRIFVKDKTRSLPRTTITLEADDNRGRGFVRTIDLPEEFGLWKYETRFWGNCHGLLLLCDYKRNLLFNPCTREYKLLPKPRRHRRVSSSTVYGLGYDHSSNDYKVVQVNHETPGLQPNHANVKVFSLKTNSWRSFELEIPHPPTTRYPAIHLNGNLYWQVLPMDGRGGHIHTMVVCFSLVKERFREVPPVPELELSNVTAALLGVWGGWLCMLISQKHSYFGIKLELWVLEEKEGRQCWTNLSMIPRVSEDSEQIRFNCVFFETLVSPNDI